MRVIHYVLPNFNKKKTNKYSMTHRRTILKNKKKKRK